MSNRMKLSPRRTAARDQGLALARDTGGRGDGTFCLFVDYAAPGQQCCWCDCPDAQVIADPVTHMGNCPTPCPQAAGYLVTGFAGTPAEDEFLVCAGHRDNLPGFFTDLISTMQGQPVTRFLLHAWDPATESGTRAGDGW